MTEVLNSSWVFALFHGYRFSEGFGKVTGSEYDSLFSFLLFTFIGDDVLIPIEQDRKRMQLMYADIFDNYREFKTNDTNERRTKKKQNKKNKKQRSGALRRISIA